MGKVSLRRDLLHEIFGQRQRALETLLEGLLALGAHQGVWIVAFGQEEKAQLPPLSHLRQGIVQSPPRRRADRAFAIEGKDDFIDQTKRALEVLGSGRRAERRHGVLDSGLMQSNHIHVALDHHQAAQRLSALAYLVEAVQLAPLVKEARLGRIQIFRFALIDDPSAEGDHPTPRIADGEHDPVAETIVELVSTRTGRGVALDHKTRRQQRLPIACLGAEALQHIVPGLRGVADAELLQRLGA